MYKGFIVLGLVALAAGACTNNPQTNRELNCAAGVAGGAVAGGLLGNQFAKGTGKQAMTAAGTAGGVLVAAQNPNCR